MVKEFTEGRYGGFSGDGIVVLEVFLELLRGICRKGRIRVLVKRLWLGR